MTQQQLQQTGQPSIQTFDQFLPQEVTQTVTTLEQLESDAEWAHGQAMQLGDSMTAQKLADIAQIAHLQKNLLLRQSGLAQTVSQCTQQALQQCTQQLQQSQTPGVQGVVQLAQQASRTISQASAQVAQSSHSQQISGQSLQSGGGGQTFQY